MLSTQNRGITGIFALFSILFIRDQYVIWPVSGFERVLPIFVKYCLLASSMILELCAIIFSISTSLLSGLPFLTKFLYARFYLRMKFFIDFVIQGA